MGHPEQACQGCAAGAWPSITRSMTKPRGRWPAHPLLDRARPRALLSYRDVVMLQGCRDAAVDIKRVPIDEGRSAAGQEDRGADQFVDIAPARGRRALLEP